MTTARLFPCKREDVIWRKMGEESVLLDLATENYYTLDEVGSRIWELIDGRSSTSEIAAQISQEYDVTTETAEGDIEALLNELRGAGLLE